MHLFEKTFIFLQFKPRLKGWSMDRRRLLIRGLIDRRRLLIRGSMDRRLLIRGSIDRGWLLFRGSMDGRLLIRGSMDGRWLLIRGSMDGWLLIRGSMNGRLLVRGSIDRRRLLIRGSMDRRLLIRGSDRYTAGTHHARLHRRHCRVVSRRGSGVGGGGRQAGRRHGRPWIPEELCRVGSAGGVKPVRPTSLACGTTKHGRRRNEWEMNVEIDKIDECRE